MTRKWNGPKGVVYLIHFNTPFKHAKHYVGWTTDLEARLADHRAGSGSALMAAVNDAGIGWSVVATWQKVDRFFERKMHRLHGVGKYCPACSGDKTRNLTAKSY